jgi:hypothetical protein
LDVVASFGDLLLADSGGFGPLGGARAALKIFLRKGKNQGR